MVEGWIRAYGSMSQGVAMVMEACDPCRNAVPLIRHELGVERAQTSK